MEKIMQEARDIFLAPMEIETIPLEESLKIMEEIHQEEVEEVGGGQPVIVITIWNGLLDDVECNLPARVIVLEHDHHTDPRIEGQAWADFGGHLYSVRKWQLEARTTAVREVVEEVGLP